jgi:hypothetical protein
VLIAALGGIAAICRSACLLLWRLYSIAASLQLCLPGRPCCAVCVLLLLLVVVLLLQALGDVASNRPGLDRPP